MYICIYIYTYTHTLGYPPALSLLLSTPLPSVYILHVFTYRLKQINTCNPINMYTIYICTHTHIHNTRTRTRTRTLTHTRARTRTHTYNHLGARPRAHAHAYI